MGWDVPYNTPTKASVIELILRDLNIRDTVLAHRVVGDKIWVVQKIGERQGKGGKHSGKKVIALYLLRSAGDNWGYKDLSETSEPFYYDCPESFLEMATDFAEERGSAEWRKGVREFHAKRKAIAAMEIKAGLSFELGGSEYTVEAPYHKKGYWTVIRTRDGSRFKAAIGEVKEALYEAGKPAAQAEPEQMSAFA